MFYPKRWKQLIYLLLCVAFVGIGVTILIKDGDPIAWACIAFFGLGVGVFGVQLFPGAAYLTLTQEGFEMCSLFKKHFTPWKDVEAFGLGELGIRKMVLIKFAAHVRSMPVARELSAFVTNGWDGGLPDNYGLDYSELVALMNRYLAESRLQS